jgi:NodT family efflux transporter outer membrane factor (OMF) lipoprotein
MSPHLNLSVPRAATLGTLLLLSACGVGPDYRSPELPPTATYGTDATAPVSVTAGAAHKEQLKLGMDIPAQWWGVFHCAELDALVATTLKNNPNVDAAKASLKAAHEFVLAQQGAYYPTVAASVQPSRQKVPRNFSSPLASGNDIFNLTTSQVNVSYTPDLFGGNARAVESLVAQEDQQRYELEAVRLTLASNVVVAAITDAMLREQIDQTKAIILDQRQIMDSYRKQNQLGQASSADIAAQEALLAAAEAAMPPLEKQYRINRDLLAALQGRTPGEPFDVKFTFNAMTVPAQLPLSLPAELVKHRPDVRIAEEQLHAACAQIGVAVAARWPSFTIDGSLGTAALALVPEFGVAAQFASIAATLTQPIFDGGTLQHKQHAAEALFDQSAALYRATVIGAFQNTADVLHALWTDADALRDAEAAESAARRTLEIARKQLVLGDVTKLIVLGDEQAENQAVVTLLQTRAARYADVVALFQALGGGWWNRDDAVAADKPEPPAK